LSIAPVGSGAGVVEVGVGGGDGIFVVRVHATPLCPEAANFQGCELVVLAESGKLYLAFFKSHTGKIEDFQRVV